MNGFDRSYMRTMEATRQEALKWDERFGAGLIEVMNQNQWPLKTIQKLN
jgi:hypothetical protein